MFHKCYGLRLNHILLLFVQATAEQIRLAQMISDHNDADFEEKVKQLVDITGKDQDESMIALHDCNGDVNRAINILLEGSPDTDSWEMVGKKKGVSGQKESAQTDGGDEGKENREKGGERDVARRRGGAPRRGRGASRGRDFRGQENGLDGAKAGGVAGRGMERGRRGRGRGRGGAGRRGGRFSAQGMGTFNPADYTEPAQTEESYTSGSSWSNTGNLEPEDGNSAWRTATEEWGMEDWNEDLSETKIFTASSVASMPIPQENVTITAGQRIDLAVLLGKTPPSSSSEAEPASLEGPQPPSLSQSLVFSNSKQTASLSQSSSSAPYSQHSMVSMLSKGFGDVGDPKGTTGGSTTGSQFLAQIKTARALAQLAAQHSQSGPPNAGPSTWDTSPTTLGQYGKRADRPVHSPFTKRQPYQPISTSSSMMDAFLQDKATPASTTSTLPPQSTSSSSLPQAVTTPLSKPSGPNPGQQNSSSPADPQASSPLPLQQHKLKQQKKRASITTKIPALAVEMPGSADISGLNLQFGALQFGSEPVLPEYDASAAVATTTSSNQGQNSLYTSASKWTTTCFISTSCYKFGKMQATALSNPSQMELYEPRASQTRRYPPSVSSSPQKDIQSKVRVSLNSQSGVPCAILLNITLSFLAAAGSAVPLKPASESVVPPSVSNISSLADPSSGPPSLLTTSNQTPLSALGHEDSSPSSLATPQHNKYGILFLRNFRLICLDKRDANSTACFPSAPSLHSKTVWYLLQFAVRAQVWKAPPNLPPGVPPLLPNPYIMAPGLLHPYPPQMYGYDDLQMLQTRIPLDYYSIPFATPTTALTGREGSLTGNPYSAGDLSKFGRGDASSPAPATTLALVAPTSSKQHGVNVGVNASATPFQQASGYGSHGYSTGVSVTSSNTGVPDISGSVYTKTQSFEKQGFHTGTPSASFSLPSALGSGGPINPPAAAGYAPAPYMHILTPHQQPHSQMLHHHLQQDGQVSLHHHV
uniref:Ubiquitin associated protein 2-like n=1 Tax=Cyprinus carpio TaxID=7962 RepID=A0A8C2J7C3_CYPCA